MLIINRLVGLPPENRFHYNTGSMLRKTQMAVRDAYSTIYYTVDSFRFNGKGQINTERTD